MLTQIYLMQEKRKTVILKVCYYFFLHILFLKNYLIFPLTSVV